jgi:hypothetical protein
MGLLGRIGIGASTLGLSELLGEDAMSGIPVLNSIGGYKSDEEKALLAKQDEMAKEAKKRQDQNAQMRIQALGQSLLAFAPRNQMMAQMFGPQAAFTPEQMHQMSADPRGAPQADPATMALLQKYPNLDQKHAEWFYDEKIGNQEHLGKALDQQRAMKEWEEKERQRLAALQAFDVGSTAPTPLGPRPARAAARKF